MATSMIQSTYSETIAFQFFAELCWEEHQKRFPSANLDPNKFAEVSTGRWNSITQDQKDAFFSKFKEDDGSKTKNSERKENKINHKKPKEIKTTSNKGHSSKNKKKRKETKAKETAV